jgi:hypothetical protein
VRDQWIASLLKIGLADRSQLNDLSSMPSDQGGSFAGEYVAKFGRDRLGPKTHEVTKGLAKRHAPDRRHAPHPVPAPALQFQATAARCSWNTPGIFMASGSWSGRRV